MMNSTFDSLPAARKAEPVMSGPLGAALPASVHGVFETQVDLRPDAIAVESPQGSLSFAALNRAADDLAARLRRETTVANEIIGIRFTRCAEWIVAMLAVLKAGGCYLPLNPKDPEARVAALLEDARPRLILKPSRVAGEFRIENRQSASSEPDAEGLCEDRAAYVMYTSGSTGKPKGVVVSHRNILRLTQGRNPVPLGPGTRTMQTGAPTFDAVTFEIWGTLLNGGCVILPGEDTILSAAALGKELAARQATTLWLTSPLFNQLAAEDSAAFKPLSHLIVGGDVVVRRHVQAVQASCPGLTVVNGYGPTENTTFSTMHVIQHDDPAMDVPIGLPIAYSTAYVLDNQGSPAAPGTEGELFVGGDGVALGYLNQAELTAERFLPDPFTGKGRMYRTGDLVRQRKDGEIVFLGRRDSQVKVRGYRIELGEIENLLREHEEVSEAVAAVAESPLGPKLVVYAVADETISDLDLRSYLLSVLPGHMVPHFIVFLEALPLTSHGKVDRSRLPTLEEFDLLSPEYVAPETELELQLADVISQCTGLDGAGTADSFFDLGIDSLAAARISAALQKETGIHVPVTSLLAHPSIAELSTFLQSKDCKPQSEPPVSPAPGLDGVFPLTPQQMPLYVEQMKNPASVRYNVPVMIDLPTDTDFDRLEQALSELVQQREALRLVMQLSQPPSQRIAGMTPVALPRVPRAVDPKQDIRPFDLQTGPLWRASLHDTGSGWQLFLDMHHIIADGVTLAMVLGDLDRLYRGEALSAAGASFAEISQWAHEGAGAELREAQRAFWRSRLQDTPVLRDSLPMDFPRTPERSRESGVLRFDLGAARLQRCKLAAKNYRLTLFELLAGVYGLFLSRVTGEQTVTFGIPAHARAETGFSEAYGMLANTVCVRLETGGDAAAGAFLRTSGQVLRDSIAHQHFPFRDLVDMTESAGNPARNPLFDTLFALQTRDSLTVDFLGAKHLLRPLPPGQAMFDLNLQLYQSDTGIDAEWEYDASLFQRDTVVALQGILLDLVDQLTDPAADTLPVSRLGVLPSTPAGQARPEAELEFDF
ncbi:hypothetical protein AB838_06170 [Rhodobacteraceae bacterium (ex Bugula neritina AB1)]|nr:hypothetical protein AB838_06170 [Rhodobacteraceae bacterium (ex Bugula neritina AB1)]